ncbi:MAG: hypothetical protein CVV56_01745 [Tenericutes bacterium HGW-Tenericutes-1]|jgi:hypothetical protein|nr:MAG: hypothetical protein CVV56_01745 [Tenericutes bacterium HGW-Tenericutes-1]
MILSKRSLLLLLLFILSITLIGCTDHSDKELIYDNEELQIEIADSYTYSLRDDESENVVNQIDLSFRGFIGRDTIWTIDVTENTEIDITYISELRSGQFKVVLITPDNEVHSVLTMTDQGSETVAFPEGKYYIKLIGINAFGSISMNIENVQGVTITKLEK